MSNINSMGSIYALGHRALDNLFSGPVRIDEKIDGSQFGFRKRDKDGVILMRSKGALIMPEQPPKMFRAGVDYVLSIADKIPADWTFRCEYLEKPKHNALAYNRIPKNHLMLFDIEVGGENYLDYESLSAWANDLGIEAVPRLYEGKVSSIESIKALLNTQSVLGGQNIEGVVVKNYDQFGPDKKILMGKYVSEDFKEVHRREWKSTPSGKEILDQIGDTLTTPARWQKALVHLREKGLITGTPKDIGLLVKEVWPDILKEERDYILDKLWQHAEPKLQRMVIRGLPEWYKKLLAEGQIVGQPSSGDVDSRRECQQESVPVHAQETN